MRTVICTSKYLPGEGHFPVTHAIVTNREETKEVTVSVTSAAFQLNFAHLHLTAHEAKHLALELFAHAEMLEHSGE